MRELAKRTFQYMNERGMVPITMPHMTSTSILPMLSFATVQYDWEWKYSEGDVQGRFPREYIQLVSNGDLAGTWPVLLGEHGAQENDPWTQRTYAAVCLVHEMEPNSRLRSVWDPLLAPIYRLLDAKGLQVYRYWDERPQPASTGDPDLPLIVYSLPGKEALIEVTSYADHDANVTLRLDTKRWASERLPCSRCRDRQPLPDPGWSPDLPPAPPRPPRDPPPAERGRHSRKVARLQNFRVVGIVQCIPTVKEMKIRVGS